MIANGYCRVNPARPTEKYCLRRVPSGTKRCPHCHPPRTVDSFDIIVKAVAVFAIVISFVGMWLFATSNADLAVSPEQVEIIDNTADPIPIPVHVRR